MNALNPYELTLLNAIADKCGCAFLDTLMPILTLFGEFGAFWITVGVILGIIPKTRKIGLTILVSLLLGLIFGNGILKKAVARIRPYDMEGALFTAQTLLVPALTDFSFPSGHSLCCVESATVLMCTARKPWGWIASGIAVVVMFSRMYLYVHYPTDVLGGLLFGILNALAAIRLVDFVWKKAADYFAKRKGDLTSDH